MQPVQMSKMCDCPSSVQIAIVQAQLLPTPQVCTEYLQDCIQYLALECFQSISYFPAGDVFQVPVSLLLLQTWLKHICLEPHHLSDQPHYPVIPVILEVLLEVSIFLGTMVPQYEIILSEGLSGPVSYRLPIGRATEFIQSEQSIMD